MALHPTGGVLPETVLDSVKVGSGRATCSKTFLDIAGARIKPIWESRYFEDSQMHPVSMSGV